MPPAHLTQLLEATLHDLEAYQLNFAAWRAWESPQVVQEVLARLQGHKTLDEVMTTLRAIIKERHGPRRRQVRARV